MWVFWNGVNVSELRSSCILSLGTYPWTRATSWKYRSCLCHLLSGQTAVRASCNIISLLSVEVHCSVSTLCLLNSKVEWHLSVLWAARMPLIRIRLWCIVELCFIVIRQPPRGRMATKQPQYLSVFFVWLLWFFYVHRKWKSGCTFRSKQTTLDLRGQVHQPGT